MYYLVYGLVRLLSLIPLPILYIFSDFIYVLVYYVFGYRKKVVLSNLLIAFPDKTNKERIRIAKDFYHNLIDTFIETLKFFSWNFSDIENRCSPDLSGLEEAYATGRPIHIIAMHNFNWEYLNWWMSKNSPLPFVGIYGPIGNKHLDKMFLKMRSKYGTILIPATDFKVRYQAYHNQPHILGSVADQSPGNPLNAYWLDFFGKKTAFIKGAERGAVSGGVSVVFVHFYKTKRGHYFGKTEFVTADASTWGEGKLTKAFAAFVEKSIRSKPANYLWSHRRWKHEWKPEYAEITI